MNLIVELFALEKQCRLAVQTQAFSEEVLYEPSCA